MDDAVGSLEPLLELAARDEAAGLPDAPWPPHFDKQAGEAPRVQPSKRRTGGADAATPSPTGRRQSTKPLIEIARAASKAEAMDGLERWKARHAGVWPHLKPADVLVDSMRGRSSSWYRIRLNLEHVPEDERPPQEPLEVDYDPWGGIDPREAGRSTSLPAQSSLTSPRRNCGRCSPASDAVTAPTGTRSADCSRGSRLARRRRWRGRGTATARRRCRG
jgi:hypothetical protein